MNWFFLQPFVIGFVLYAGISFVARLLASAFISSTVAARIACDVIIAIMVTALGAWLTLSTFVDPISGARFVIPKILILAIGVQFAGTAAGLVTFERLARRLSK